MLMMVSQLYFAHFHKNFHLGVPNLEKIICHLCPLINPPSKNCSTNCQIAPQGIQNE